MRFLIWLAVLIGCGVAAVPWFNASFDEAGLREDAVAAPNLSRAGSSISAATIASYLMHVAKQRGIELQPENLRIEVSAAEAGALGGLQVGGKQLAGVQKVILHVDYRHPIYLGLTKHMEFTIRTSGIGNGGASTFPISEQEEESHAPADAAPPDDAPATE
jgi:hypothetical protein